jgi:hypothetical protein
MADSAGLETEGQLPEVRLAIGVQRRQGDSQKTDAFSGRKQPGQSGYQRTIVAATVLTAAREPAVSRRHGGACRRHKRPARRAPDPKGHQRAAVIEIHAGSNPSQPHWVGEDSTTQTRPIWLDQHPFLFRSKAGRTGPCKPRFYKQALHCA